MADLCQFPRRFLQTRYTWNPETGAKRNESAEWIEANCNAPLFGSDTARSDGFCSSCRNGWAHPQNLPLRPQAFFAKDGRRFGLWAIPPDHEGGPKLFELRDTVTNAPYNSPYAADDWLAELHDVLQAQGFLLVPETLTTRESLPDALKVPVRTKEDAMRWIAGLHDAGLSFHFDDSPETITRGGTDESLFTDDECKIIRRQVAAIRSFDYGPWECEHGFAMHVACTEQARREFPDMPAWDLPELPMDGHGWTVDGGAFVDASYRNDVSPRFESVNLGLALWVDYADREQREWVSRGRYILLRCLPDPESVSALALDPHVTLYEGESFAHVAALVIREAAACAMRGDVPAHTPQELAKLWAPWLEDEGVDCDPDSELWGFFLAVAADLQQQFPKP